VQQASGTSSIVIGLVMLQGGEYSQTDETEGQHSSRTWLVPRAL
jgi:hypothetical protein